MSHIEAFLRLAKRLLQEKVSLDDTDRIRKTVTKIRRKQLFDNFFVLSDRPGKYLSNTVFIITKVLYIVCFSWYFPELVVHPYLAENSSKPGKLGKI